MIGVSDPRIRRAPGQISGRDRNAGPANARAGIEGHEAKGLGGCRLDHFPDIHIHRLERSLQFVDQGDIDGAKAVFDQFHRFGRGGRTDRHRAGDNGAIKILDQLQGLRIVGTDHFGNVVGVELVIARIFAFRRKGQEEIGAGVQAAGLENGLHQRRRGAGPDAAFQHHHLTGAQMLRDGLCGGGNKAHVRILFVGQRSWHADQDDIGLGQCGGVLSCTEPATIHRLRDPVLRQV